MSISVLSFRINIFNLRPVNHSSKKEDMRTTYPTWSIGFLTILLFFAVTGIQSKEPEPSKSARSQGNISSVSLYVFFPSGGWHFAVIYKSGLMSAGYYLPPDQGKICDGIAVRTAQASMPTKSELELAEEIFKSENQEELDASTTAKIELSFTNHDSKRDGKAYIQVWHINGERKLYERSTEGRFNTPTVRELNDALMKYVTNCQL
jgi:hypothetical protein